MALRRQREEELNKDKHAFTEIRKHQQQTLSQVRESLQQLKHEEFMKIKQQQELNEMKKNNYMQYLQQLNLSRRKYVQEQDSQASLRKKEFFETKLRNFREQYEARIRAEEALRRKKQMRVTQLEETETELISRLKFTQSLQDEALKELQAAMNDPVDNYEKQYVLQTPNKTNKSLMIDESLLITPKRSDLLKKVRSGSNIRYIYSSVRERQNQLQTPNKTGSNYRGVASRNPDEYILTGEDSVGRVQTMPDEIGSTKHNAEGEMNFDGAVSKEGGENNKQTETIGEELDAQAKEKINLRAME